MSHDHARRTGTQPQAGALSAVRDHMKDPFAAGTQAALEALRVTWDRADVRDPRRAHPGHARGQDRAVSAAGWRHAARAGGGEETRYAAITAMLAKEFRRYAFGTRRMHGHLALEAVRHGDLSAPGLVVVVTNDIGEMRAALEGDGGDGPPG
jgi:hypothetical protein